jgi:hypothetical protein
LVQVELGAFRNVIIEVFSYGSPKFENSAKVYMKKLQVTQNKIIKLILQVPWRTTTTLIHLVANIQPVRIDK